MFSHTLMKLQTLFVVLCSCFYGLLTTQAATDDYYFKRLSIEHGLSHATVNTILRDHRGRLWVGTALGLNAVDRGNIKRYFYPSLEQPSSQVGAVMGL